MRPDTSVDDLLGDLEPVDDQPGQDEQDEFADHNGRALLPREDHPEQLAAAWSETPEVTGAPRVLGPQVCLDEAGNIVLDHSSLTKGPDQGQLPENSAPVRESMSQYTSAYRRTPACKWSAEETDMFYEALALYGTDLFLVQTFFRNKSAAQIKTKLSRELRRSPQQVEEALTTRVQRLTKDPFERLHGKIDTSKHYKPPPSPLPGEDREPDGSVPPYEEPPPPEAEPPPPEPECSAEDESLTTNRLMALFD
uniref:Myb-like domain-containing protein n=1 Tax=Pyrodinium bahamense TaxID=73915 RepID=A0A7S0B5Q6_9DINO